MLKTEGIVLSEIRFKETSKILNIYTKKYGKIPVMARGAYKPKSKLIATTQPFSYNEYILHKGRNFYYLNQGVVIDPFYNIRENIKRFAYGFYILELIEKSIPEEEENERLFLLLEKSLRILSNIDEEFLKFIVAFELKYISFLGYRPYIDSCVICNNNHNLNMKFSNSEGGIICSNCFSIDPGGKSIDMLTIKVMKKLLFTPLDSLNSLETPVNILMKLHNILEEYILYNIDRKEFNSLNLLKSITDDI
ncbi:DNA repair protein RecO [Wansuia hejianensis]|uniref:DNA repair protein RecO n=1 Tax=Wansuia hejianensis TaxID=2763667 RepID=A0A926IMT0_9FIRM|nr:DNA repair protein RecO [Wansuia hejianensis]MBC8590760.1 DNA repair protein RecO [Wansuia hejianensis]